MRQYTPPSGESPERCLEIRDLTKVFSVARTSTTAFRDVTFSVDEGEFVSVLGASGCGKTTLLHVLGGLERESAGEVLIRGEKQTERAHFFAYMFQKDLLLPWYKIRDNAALGLVLNDVSRKDARDRADSLLRDYGLGRVADMYPTQLSGGMRQRVALIRTLLLDRPFLLLDEPFGALDALTRLQMQDWLLSIWEANRRTVVFVTHDVDEAVRLSDRVLVMSQRPGRLRETHIELQRPRTQDVVAAEYVDYRRELLATILKGD